MLIFTFEQFNKYEKLCKLIKKTKSKFRSARYKANIVKIGNYFLNKDFKNGWRCLKKKMTKPSYSSTSLMMWTIFQVRGGLMEKD